MVNQCSVMERIINFRELGGIKTKDNAIIKPEMLFRSAAPETGSVQDIEKLSALNISQFIDFRAKREKDEEKSNQFNQHFPRVNATINVGNFFSEDKLLELKEMKQDNAFDIFLQIYEQFVTDYQSAYQTFFSHLNQGKKVFFHCTAGKDRTGFAGYLVLSALNVHPADIMENFLESNKRTEPLFNNNIEHAAKLGVDPDFYATFRVVREEYLNAAIKKIDDLYGDIESFLKNQLQVDLDRVKHFYLN